MQVYPYRVKACTGRAEYLCGGFGREEDMETSIWGTLIAGGIVLLLVGLVVWKMVKDKKSGKSIQCGGDCSKCKGCH